MSRFSVGLSICRGESHGVMGGSHDKLSSIARGEFEVSVSTVLGFVLETDSGVMIRGGLEVVACVWSEIGSSLMTQQYSV